MLAIDEPTWKFNNCLRKKTQWNLVEAKLFVSEPLKFTAQPFYPLIQSKVTQWNFNEVQP